MRIIFAAPPGNFVWPRLTRKLGVKDILASYYYFGDERQRPYLNMYLGKEEPPK